MTRFDRDTSLTAAGPGRFAGTIDRGWWIERGPNGGYVAALVLRGLTMAVDDPARTPRSLTIHYLAPPVEGPAEVETTIERPGRSLTYVSGRLVQDGVVKALAVAAFAVPRESMSFQHLTMPEAPPASEVAPPPDLGGPSIPLRERYDTRYVLGPAPFSEAATAETGGWIRLAEPRPMDPLLLAALTDAWIPPVFMMMSPEQRVGVPTIDLTVHFRGSADDLAALADDEFVFAAFRSRVASGGYIEEDGEIWSPSGVLLAQSRQLALLLA